MPKDVYERYRPRDEFLDEDGRFLPDPVPMAPPVGYVKQESMAQIVQRMVRSEHLRLAAIEAGAETFEEADDFDVGDDDPTSPYEEQFDPVDAAIRQDLRQAEFNAKYQERLNDAAMKAGIKPNGDKSTTRATRASANDQRDSDDVGIRSDSREPVLDGTRDENDRKPVKK